MIRIKICGLCRPADAAAAVAAGADYVGVILAPATRRSQTIDTAKQIFDEARGARRVGVFVNPEPSMLREAIRDLQLDVVQLHGEETPDVARLAGESAQVWKAVRVQAPDEIGKAARAFSGAVHGLLLDAFHPTLAGGSGTRLEWLSLTAERGRLPAGLQVVLAGGLTPENVADAVRALVPDVVDVSSGVEAAIGEKSVERMCAFVAAARSRGIGGSDE
ncbi:MAG: phosphoribosylanthranilate isomerase [Gemmatimonadota bacterium]